MHILWFFFHADVKMQKTVHETYSLLKTYFSLIIEYGMYLNCLQKPRFLVCSKQAKRSDPQKTRLNSSKDNVIANPQETEHSFELSLSICVFYRRIFNLEMQNFSLVNNHMMNARQPFCCWMTFTTVSNPFLPSPPKIMVDMTIGRFRGSRVWVILLIQFENFFPNLTGVRNFFPEI